jgi:AbrB family looped-hinge helix DNA binding protein
MDGMATPSRVRIDRQGRIVLPQHIRDELVEVPGELLLERTPDGVLLRPVGGSVSVRTGDDGLPVISVGRAVTNDEVLAAIDAERAGR